MAIIAKEGLGDNMHHSCAPIVLIMNFPLNERTKSGKIRIKQTLGFAQE